MTDTYAPIRELLDQARARWRRLCLFRAAARGAVEASLLLAAGLAASQWSARSPGLLMLSAAASLILAAGAIGSALAPLRHVPSNRRMARFIEERNPALDDRLVTAVDFVEAATPRSSSALGGPMLTDAAAGARAVDLETVLPTPILRRAGLQAAGAMGLLLTLAMFAVGPARQSVDAASLLLFPSRVQLSVRPGDARITAGTPLAIDARLVGNRAPVDAYVQIEQGQLSRAVAMPSAPEGAFRLLLDSVTEPFTYRVVAGALTSPTYTVTVARPPRVTRIDLDYLYPPALDLKPRTEEDAGDIYAPAATAVRIRIHTDRPAATGRLALAAGGSLALEASGPALMSATMNVVADGSYRVVLADRDGLSSEGDTEYFIRVLEDRPPEVHITKPAGDRGVTRLEEVDIEAQADDDRGIARLELVYAVRGGPEQSIALDVPPHATTVNARHTLFLEDLDLQPGDFVSYYVRARDLTRTARANEGRSDLFFLDVRPYEQEFSLAQSQSMSGSGYGGALDELVNKQRQVVVATWKLDRRADAANGTRPSDGARGAGSVRDIRAVARTEADLKSLVEQTASTFRESTMRDPRRRAPGAAPGGQARPEEDAMTAAADAMGRAGAALEALKTAGALPPEMEALNHLLKAQADIRRRQLSTSQSAGSAGDTNKNYDISTLFDRELQRQQQTSYETPAGSAPRPAAADTLDRIKELAKRQDELLRRQKDAARAPRSSDEKQRELEQLTREQAELRRQAEELERQMSGSQSKQSSQSLNARNGQSDDRRQMRDVSEQMRQAAGDLRRGAPEAAGASAGRALDTLRELERRLQKGAPDDRQRALGDIRLEASQLADGERQIASDLGKAPGGAAGIETRRRLAGEQDRLVERMRRLQDAVRNGRLEAERDLKPQTLAGLSDRMRKSANDLRGGSASPRTEEAIATELDRLAERLGEATGARKDDEARKRSAQLGRAQELRDKLDEIGRAMESAARENGRAAGRSAQRSSGESGRTGEGRQGAGGTDFSRLREESLRQLEEARKLLDELQRQDLGQSKNGAGFTLEGQGFVMSAPGTEAFKRDFDKWNVLKQQAMAALEQAGTVLAAKAQAAASRGRLAAGVEDKAPPDYQKQVDAYFKGLAGRKP